MYRKKEKLNLKPQDIEFTPYPGIPTDLQPMFCLLMTQVSGESRLDDKVYNQRTQYIAELQKMGALINIEDINGKHIIDVSYSSHLKGNNVQCTDIRGGMAIILAAMMARGKSEISNEYQVKRGYNSLIKTLNSYGFSVLDNRGNKNYINDFNASQWPIKINEPWEKSLHYPLLTADSKICVLGDCFARNFSRWFKEQGVETGNIPWGIHFHQKAILRELQRTIKKDDTPNMYWKLKEKSGEILFIDPFRHPIEANTLEKLKEKQNEIETKKKNYFKNTDFFVVSLSIGEIWEEKINGKWQPLGRGPTEENYNPEVHRYRNLSIEETKKDISEIISAIKEINPDSKIIFMVSPVPLKHSLHEEQIYVSNNRSKTTLLGAIYEVMDSKPEDVFYFPAYEMVQKDNKKSYWQEDKRHLTAECVVDVCKHFVQSFFLDKETFDKNKIFQVREVDQEGHVVREISENTYFLKEARYKLAKKIDKTLGTNIRKVKLPRFAEKTEIKINKIYEKMKKEQEKA